MFKRNRKHIVMTQFDAYLDDTLSPAQRKRYEDHLAACESCREWVAKTNQLIDRLTQEKPSLNHLPNAAASRIEHELERQFRNKWSRYTLFGGLRMAGAWAMLAGIIALVVWQLPFILDATLEDTHEYESENQAAANAGLIEAVQAGDSEGIERYLAAGADPNALDEDDFFFKPILRTAVVNEDLEAVTRLLESGADANGLDSQGDEILWRAVTAGNVELVRLLLDAGANVDTRNNLGETPLGIALFQRDAEIIDLLLEAGADPNARTVINLNYHTGSPVDYQYPPLCLAAFHGELHISQTLLDAGADINGRAIPLEGGGTHENRPLNMPIHVAAQENQLEMILFLLDNGAELEAPAIHGTPLGNAATFGSIEAVKLLIDLGADPNVEWTGSWSNLSDQTIDEIRQLLQDAQISNSE